MRKLKFVGVLLEGLLLLASVMFLIVAAVCKDLALTLAYAGEVLLLAFIFTYCLKQYRAPEAKLFPWVAESFKSLFKSSPEKKQNLSVLTKGILKENPVFILVLGTCPTLAVTTNVIGALGMGLATLAVLVCSNVIISLLRKIIPDGVRIPSYIVIIAGFVTIVQMCVQALSLELYQLLGVYLQLITVNCIILGRAEMFAAKNSVGKSALDGIGMGIGFTLALLSMAIIREVFGAASFAGIAIPVLQDFKIEFLAKAPGGMLVYGLLIALVGVITHGKGPVKKSFSCASCPSAPYCNTGACNNEMEGTADVN